MKQERSADRRKHHIIYKTTCLVTSRYYIGMHSTDDLADGYIGSGKRLWQSIRKHGVEQHVCEVLEQLPSREALILREAEIIDERLLEDKLCMNLVLGGEGGGGWALLSDEDRLSLSRSGTAKLKMLCAKDNKYCAPKTEAGRKRMLENRRANGLAANFGQYAKLGGAAAAKVLPEFWKKFYETGGRSALQDKRWVCNEQGARLVQLSELQAYLDQGFTHGKAMREPSKRLALQEQRMTDYQRLQPTCRNLACAKLLTYTQHRNGVTSCSKSCSNRTR